MRTRRAGRPVIWGGLAGLLAMTAMAAVPPALAAPAAGRISRLHLPGDWFGRNVAVSGSIAVVSAAGTNNGAGAVYIFARSNGRWHQQAELKDPAHTGADAFGSAVSISGQTALIEADGVNNGAGAAYFYVRSNGAWHQEAAIPGASPGNGNFSGPVAVSGTTATVGTDDFADGGAALIYGRSGATWHLQATISNPLGVRNINGFPIAAAVSGSTAVFGAERFSLTGGAFVYVRSGSTWHRQARLRNPDAARADQFGGAVAICGSTIAVGSWNYRHAIGSVYVYVRSGSTWHLQKKLVGQGKAGEFGSSVALSGTARVMRLLVGAPDAHSHSGDVYSYTRRGTTWREKADIANPGGAFPDFFGDSLGLAGRKALIGAPGTANFTGTVYQLTVP